jgi:hypothetical protein
MKIAAVVSRAFLGLGFVVFGLNILHPFLSMPPFPDGSQPGLFMAVMVPSGWMKLVGLAQLSGGLLVLLGGTAPLGLLVLAPVLVNILAFHVFLMGGAGIAPGIVFSILAAFLFYAYRGNFAAIFTIKAVPTTK